MQRLVSSCTTVRPPALTLAGVGPSDLSPRAEHQRWRRPEPNRGSWSRSALGALLLLLGCAALPGRGATMPVLGAAADFAVLAGTGITISDATTVIGDIGTYPTTTITGLEKLTLYGTDYTGNAIMPQVMAALLSAYTYAAGLTPTVTYPAVQDLGGLTLGPGIYNDPSSFAITETLTLDAGNNPSAFWVFQAGTTLTTSTSSAVVLINGAQADHVFWQVGSSATLLGPSTDFVGTILALESITLNTGAAVDGRVLAYNGAVTLNRNVVAVPEANTISLLSLAVAGAVVCSRRSRTWACLGSPPRPPRLAPNVAGAAVAPLA